MSKTVLGILFLAITTSSAFASQDSIGPNGINSASLLGLTGAGVGIGQVEPFRPGIPGTDSAANSNPDVQPTGVFVRDGAAAPNMNIDEHALQVAGVMISTDMVDSDVIPDGDSPV